MRTIVKERPDAPEHFFEAEAAGLRWLGEAERRGGARVVRVAGVGPGRIELERVEQTRPTAAAARGFGVALAATHATGALAFGAPPDGWGGPLFIGRRPLPVAHEASWGRFYARDRVRPYLDPAVQAGNLGARQRAVVEDALERVEAGEFDDDEPPARLHGDLWTGNVLWSPDGVVLIDPAAHGGHRETDLAMLALFGCPHLDFVVSGYLGEHRLDAQWQERVALHQLLPLMVHAVLFGGDYAHRAVELAKRYR